MALTSHSLLSRLYRDLAELRDSPYPGVSVFLQDEDIRKFCLVLTPDAGPWKNMSFHFVVNLPPDWPARPPQISISNRNIGHPNLFDGYVCCDLIKEEALVSRWDGYSGGYSPALTLRGLFLQFLTFFSSTTVEQDYGGAPYYIGDYLAVWYIRESDLRGGQLPAMRGNSHRDVAGSLFASSLQDSLRSEWDKDKRPLIVLRTEMSEVGPLTHTTKGPRQHKDRLIRVEEKDAKWTRTLQSIRKWSCQSCPYGSAELPHCVPVVALQPKPEKWSPLLVPPPKCLLDNLSDDVLYELASVLPSELVINFGTAYPRLHAIVHPLVYSVLGIGISFDFRARTLASDFDWLSQRAFDEFGVRMSVEKRLFSLFLPLAFSPHHFERVYPQIWMCLAKIDGEVRRADEQMSKNPRRRAEGPPRKEEQICVVYKMMSNCVVALMRNCDDALDANGNGKSILHASEKAVIAYCHLFHLLIKLAQKDDVILRDATRRLRRFIDDKDSRSKSRFPDLGELIILIMLVICCPPVPEARANPIKWADIAGPFLEEVMTRNVRWILKDAPELEWLEDGESQYRLKETFTRSKTSLRLVMFQITFLDVFYRAYAANLGRLDDNYGFPDKDLPTTMVEQIKAIYAIGNWTGFFRRVRFEKGVSFGPVRFSEILRDAVKLSAARRYHTAASRDRMLQLKRARERAEASSR
ncbi:UBIQUITIN-CONJUGAT-2 domain-containing protein [Mycena chlorophos]|uniref:UBIQUITIN-CONJUGAT-2 domain-containing protein n=1 Tax=Mycena chlorophos TaxID=658473 RepID=A0A8H6VSL6_MYCCL|nr:UBIQUITIN-CONJUGAT-2 domain-containing protein [Mycena chlorophos]